MSPEDKELQRLKQRDHVSKHYMCVFYVILRWEHGHN
jgi:hypothetical protein